MAGTSFPRTSGLKGLGTTNVRPSNPAESAVSTFLAGVCGFARYLGGVLGADAYRKYLEHHAESGHDNPHLCERDFWRDRTDRQGSNPQGRCC